MIDGCCCCCCLHIKSRSGLYSVLSSIRTGPTDADAFRGHRLTTQLCMVINISVQYNGGFLPDIILLTQGYYQWGTRLNTM